MKTVMSAGWLEWKEGQETQRRALRAGLTLIGGVDGDIPHPDSGTDQLQVWDDPPKVVYLGGGDLPQVGKLEGPELELKPGDVIRWRGMQFAFGCGGLGAAGAEAQSEAELEEVDLSTAQDAPLPDRSSAGRPKQAAGAKPRQAPAEGSRKQAQAKNPSKSDAVAWARVKAGLFVELGIADPQVTRVWQQSIARGEFDSDACTRDILRVSHFPESDPRLVQRSARLQRDLIMSPLQSGARGASRRAKRAAKGGLAFIVAQVVVMLVFTVILGVFLLLARVQWDFSVDGLLDSVRAMLPG